MRAMKLSFKNNLHDLVDGVMKYEWGNPLRRDVLKWVTLVPDCLTTGACRIDVFFPFSHFLMNAHLYF